LKCVPQNLLIFQNASHILNKNFSFLKMHMQAAHAIPDTKRKGPAKHYSTILGEGGHKFVKQDAAKGDGRDAENFVRLFLSLPDIVSCCGT
jgi:hypothetical protein